jgi:hypothetical protein
MPILFKKSLSILPLIGIFFIFLAGCHTAPDNNGNGSNSKNTAMGIYSASINSIKLPFKDTCYDTIPAQKVTIPDSLTKFKDYGQLIGKVFENNKNIAILYSIAGDVQVPVLHIFSKDGKEISSLNLFIGNCCGDDEACSGISTVEITKDLYIILKDSVQVFERDKKNSDKKRNIKTMENLEEFKIDSTGNIINVNYGG